MLYFDDSFRWTLGLPSPNYLGALAAVVLPLLWFLSLKIHEQFVVWRLFCAATEAIVWTVMALTQSRGALVATGIAGAFFVWQIHRLSRLSSRYMILNVFVRTAGIAVLIFASGFLSRISPSFVAVDLSIYNRLPVWKGAMVMISARPWTGWGWGTSGWNYVNWIQNSGPSSYIGVVNTHLQLACELGVFIAAAPILIILIILQLSSACVRKCGRFSYLAISCGASLLAWLIAAIFSTLGSSKALNLAVCLVMILSMAILRISLGNMFWHLLAKTALIGSCFVSCLTAAVITIGAQINQRADVPLSWDSSGLVLNRGSPRTACIYVDPTVVGPLPGKWIRRFAKSSNLTIRVSAGDQRPQEPSNKIGIFIGETAAYAAFRADWSERILVHPTIAAGVLKTAQVGRVFLPVSEAPAWLIWRMICSQRSIPVVYTKSNGRWLDDQWPKI